MLSLTELNALTAPEAAAQLGACCGSTRWVTAMVEARPFASQAELFERADSAWDATGPADWAEAFAAHPRIGERGHAETPGSAWSAGEQRGATESTDDTRRELARLNAVYEQRFGWIYIVCASGRNGEEIRADLKSRLANAPDRELAHAAREQHRITKLRLEKLISIEGA